MSIETSFLEYPDNKSLCVILYMSGCSLFCENCHNTELQKYTKTPLDIYEQLKYVCERNRTNKLVLCGGDPLFRDNIDTTKMILHELSNDYDICIYTGYEIERVKETGIKGFTFVKCGTFDKNLFIGSEKKEEYLQFASSNQKLYNEDLELVSDNGRYYFI
jgi:anaerobic ribonucleoside-triphosphate reductase activating protein